MSVSILMKRDVDHKPRGGTTYRMVLHTLEILGCQFWWVLYQFGVPMSVSVPVWVLTVAFVPVWGINQSLSFLYLWWEPNTRRTLSMSFILLLSAITGLNKLKWSYILIATAPPWSCCMPFVCSKSIYEMHFIKMVLKSIPTQ